MARKAKMARMAKMTTMAKMTKMPTPEIMTKRTGTTNMARITQLTKKVGKSKNL